jgi:surface polysaccharide O-acyltransferase-like enzyme
MSARSAEYSTGNRNPVEYSLPVDLIRALAILLVIVTHADHFPVPVSPFYFQISGEQVWHWWVVNVYDSMALTCVPLFVMLSGALLLNPSKVDEPLNIFFRKRLKRIGLPLIFWGMVYFVWRRFADHEVLTFDSIWRGFLGVGQYPYYHFWFFYMLIGLYLVAPILRVVVAHAGSRTLGYFMLLWFLGTAVVPLLGGFASVWLSSYFFIIPGWAGYFVLGAYLRTVRLRSKILCAFLFLGFMWTAVGNWFVTSSSGATGYIGTVFTNYLSANLILASSALFLLLCAAPTDHLENRFPRAYRALRRVGQDSFAVYLLHPMVLDVLGERGLFGSNLGIVTLNPILGIPLLSLVTLVICLGIIWLLRKVPMLKRAIG